MLKFILFVYLFFIFLGAIPTENDCTKNFKTGHTYQVTEEVPLILIMNIKKGVLISEINKMTQLKKGETFNLKRIHFDNNQCWYEVEVMDQADGKKYVRAIQNIPLDKQVIQEVK